jgi:MFS family permease
MTVHAAPALGDPTAEPSGTPGRLPVRAAEAVSVLATRMSFVVVPWLLLAAEADLRTIGLVAAAQLLAYLLAGPLGVALADRSPVRAGVAADLCSALALAAVAYLALPDSALAPSGVAGVAALAGLVALAAALRAVSDRTKDAVRADADPDAARAPRSGLVRVLQVSALLLLGAGAGVLAVRLGPAGVLWLDAVLCALAAALLVQAVTDRPRPAATPQDIEVFSGEVLPAQSGAAGGGAADTGSRDPAQPDTGAAHDTADGASATSGVAKASRATAGAEAVHAAIPVQATRDTPAVNGSHPADREQAPEEPAAGAPAAPPISRTQARDLRRSALAELRADGLIRRLAAVLFLSNLLVQAGAVLLVAAWMTHVLREPDLLGLVGGAFVLGAVTGGVVLAGLTAEPYRWLVAALAFLAGGGTAAVAGGLPPVLLLIAVVSFVCGATMSSVTPALGLLLAQRVPAPVRSRVGGFASSLAYLGLPLGTVAAAWALPVLELRWALAAAAGAYLVALLVPVFAYRTWRQLSAGAPAVLTGAARLPARLSVTLAYANGQWLVEVRKGRALLGTRHLVKTAEAMSMLASLDVPGVRSSVEEALAVDQTEAARQAERMRGELAELEAKLAGLSEMAELSEARVPAQQTPQDGVKAAQHG